MPKIEEQTIQLPNERMAKRQPMIHKIQKTVQRQPHKKRI